MVRQKYSTRKTACDATGYVDDANAEAAGKFLKITHEKVLEQNSDDEVQQPAMYSNTHPSKQRISSSFRQQHVYIISGPIVVLAVASLLRPL